MARSQLAFCPRANRMGEGHSERGARRRRRLQSLAAIHPHLARRPRRSLLQQRLLWPRTTLFESGQQALIARSSWRKDVVFFAPLFSFPSVFSCSNFPRLNVLTL